MTENRLPDLLAKIAIDPSFAEYARVNPQAVADEYGLDAKAVAMLESLSVTDAADGPAPLAERLSRSSLFFGGSLAAAGDVHTAGAGVGSDGVDDQLNGIGGQSQGDLAGGRSLLEGGGKAGIIGPEGPADIIGPDGPGDARAGDGFRGPGGLAEDEDGFRPIFHPPTGRIDDGIGFDGPGGPGGPGGLDGKLDGLLGHGGPAGPGGIDVDGLLGNDGPGGPGSADGLSGKLDGLLGHGGPEGPGGIPGLGGPDGLGGAGPLGLDGPSGPGDFAGPGGFGDTGLASGVTISDLTVTPGGDEGDGLVTTHHSSVTTIDHNADGSITTTTTDLDRGEITRIDHTGGPAGTDFHIDNQEHGAPAAPPPVTGEGVHPAGHEYHAADEGPKAPPPVTGEGSHPDGYQHAAEEGPKDPQAGGRGQAPVGDGEGGVDPNRAPKGDGEGGDPNRAPGEDGGGDANTGTVITGGSRGGAPSSAGAVFVPPVGTEDPTGGAAAVQTADESAP